MDFASSFKLSLSIYFLFVGISRSVLHLVSRRFHRDQMEDPLKLAGYLFFVLSGLCFACSQVLFVLGLASGLVKSDLLLEAYMLAVLSVTMQITNSITTLGGKAENTGHKILLAISQANTVLQIIGVLCSIIVFCLQSENILIWILASSLFNIINSICLTVHMHLVIRDVQAGLMGESKAKAKFQRVIRRLLYIRRSMLLPLILDLIRIGLAVFLTSSSKESTVEIFSMFSLVFGSNVFKSFFDLSQATLDKIFRSSDFRKIKINRCDKDPIPATNTEGKDNASSNNIEMVPINFADRSVNWLSNGIPSLKEFVSWPNPINERDSEIVQVFSVLILIASIYEYDNRGTVFGFSYLAYAFLARLIAGPKIEPLHQLVIRFIRPTLEYFHVIDSHYTIYYAKRFSTFIGSCMASIVLILAALGIKNAALIMSWTWAILMMAAGFDGLCLACATFWLMTQCRVLPDYICDCKFIYEIN